MINEKKLRKEVVKLKLSGTYDDMFLWKWNLLLMMIIWILFWSKLNKVLSLLLLTEYCERYAKINEKSVAEEDESGEEDISGGQNTSSDDEISLRRCTSKAY